jgi:hypothetical protein
VADELRKEPGVEVQVVDGNYGEFKVMLDGKVVATNFLIFKPSVERIVKRVREAAPLTTGA